ncbi:hypothetical protein DSO57_1005009 [Entomophthora muscae]|uniref:Uncharacterized protein n=1 Tax=Entomophthora muscae TaxID=34485 RepID=A0ACC2SX63_9FUNG|nr:hypothetical protein DSO57_1005009 [Entomophthora muscae]
MISIVSIECGRVKGEVDLEYYTIDDFYKKQVPSLDFLLAAPAGQAFLGAVRIVNFPLLKTWAQGRDSNPGPDLL